MDNKSELLRILRMRKEKEDASDQTDESVNQESNHRQGNNTKTGGELYKIINKMEKCQVTSPTADNHTDFDCPVKRGHVASIISNSDLERHLSRDSRSSVNSHLSNFSVGTHKDSFSSFSDHSDCSSRPYSTLSIPNDNDQRRSYRYTKNKSTSSSRRISGSSTISNKSFLWTHGVSLEDLKKKSCHSTTSIETDCDRTIVADRNRVELNGSDNNNNNKENVCSSSKDIPDNENIQISSCDDTSEDEYITMPGIINDKIDYANVIPNQENNNYDSSDTDVFGSESCEDVSHKVIISAINKRLQTEKGKVEIPVYLQDDISQEPETENCDTSTVILDEFGSEHCEAVESRLTETASINECFQNEQLVFAAVPKENKADKYQRRLKNAINELLNTEAVYCTKLHHIVRDYILALKRNPPPATLAPLLPQGVFSNIQDLYKFHSQQLLPALKNADSDLAEIGRVFRQFESSFRMYLKYSKDNRKCTRNVFQYRSFFRHMQLDVGQRLDLGSYLLEPIQRMPRYRLLLDNLVKTCYKYDEEMKEDSGISCRNSLISQNSGEGMNGIDGKEIMAEETALESLQAAKTMMDKLLTKIDITVAVENIKESPIELLEQGNLLKQDDFMVTDSSKKRHQMRCFLFETLLVLAVSKKHTKEETFVYLDSFAIKDLGLTPPAEDDSSAPFTVWLQKRNNRPYTMDADPKIISAWVKEISQLLWQQAKKDKERVIRCSSRKSTQSSRSAKKFVPKTTGDFEIVNESRPPTPHLTGDQCMSTSKETNRNKRKKKVTNLNDTLTFVGRNMNVVWSSLR